MKYNKIYPLYFNLIICYNNNLNLEAELERLSVPLLRGKFWFNSKCFHFHRNSWLTTQAIKGSLILIFNSCFYNKSKGPNFLEMVFIIYFACLLAKLASKSFYLNNGNSIICSEASIKFRS